METMKMMHSKMNMMMGKNMMMNNMGMDMPMQSQQMNMMMIPRVNMKMEKCENGIKVMCMTKDETSAAMMQNLCSMLNGGMVSMCMMMNGMKMMEFNMMMGICKYEMTMDGISMTWTSGDNMICQMMQRCCDCMMSMMDCGCTAVMCMNSTPICCC